MMLLYKNISFYVKNLFVLIHHHARTTLKAPLGVRPAEDNRRVGGGGRGLVQRILKKASNTKKLILCMYMYYHIFQRFMFQTNFQII